MRLGMAQNNFPATLPPLDAVLAVQDFKDPYLFDMWKGGAQTPRSPRASGSCGYCWMTRVAVVAAQRDGR